MNGLRQSSPACHYCITACSVTIGNPNIRPISTFTSLVPSRRASRRWLRPPWRRAALHHASCLARRLPWAWRRAASAGMRDVYTLAAPCIAPTGLGMPVLVVSILAVTLMSAYRPARRLSGGGGGVSMLGPLRTQHTACLSRIVASGHAVGFASHIADTVLTRCPRIANSPLGVRVSAP